MATEAQVQANRANARKSTGPRTPEGKAAVAQNAATHGLTGRRDVIQGEDQGQFDRWREELLKELVPAGAVESLLAERAVSLSWRLQRVERLQNEAFDTLLAEGASLAKLVRSMPGKESAEDEALALGRAVVKDFTNYRVLDRLLMYERRVESSLLRTLNDLQLRRLRVRDHISRQMDELDSSRPADACEADAVNLCRGHPARDARAGSPRRDADRMSATRTPDGVTTKVPDKPEGHDARAGRPRHDADRMSATRTPDGVTTKGPDKPEGHDARAGRPRHDADRMSATRMLQDSAAGTWVGAESSCKTKPICTRPRAGQTSCGTEVMNNPEQDGGDETKPISAWSDGRTAAELPAAGADISRMCD